MLRTLIPAVLVILLPVSVARALPPIGAGVAVETLLNSIDVDGDNEATPSDRFVVDWWLDEGGQLSALLRGSTLANGVIDARDFLESQTYQAGQATSPVGAAPMAAAESSGGGAMALGTAPMCEVATFEEEPQADIVVDQGNPDIQDAICQGTGTPGSGPNQEWVIRVEDGDYSGQSIAVDPFCHPEGLILYSANGAVLTTLSGGIHVQPRATHVGLTGCQGVCPTDTPTSAAPRGPVHIGIRVVDPGSGAESLHGFTIDRGSAPSNGGGVFASSVNLAPPATQPGFQDMSFSAVGNLFNNNQAQYSGGGLLLRTATW